MGQGQARAFVTIDAAGRPAAIGITLAETALAGLPSEPPRGADGWEYVLRLPAEAASAGYNHIGIDWDPKGHLPAGVYDKPHFDFHFYLIGEDVRNAITAVGADLDRAHKLPPEGFMPAGYIMPPGTEVPRMGAHAVNPGADEFNRKPFLKTFIYGFYDGRMVFVEPMVTKAFLDAKQSSTSPITLPKAYSRPAYYPIQYSVKYDATRGEYTIALEGLVSR
jgi:hypothetical protein